MDQRIVSADDFLAAARIAGDLVTQEAVTTRWGEESACTGMTVGGLAHHLTDQAASTVRLLGDPPGEEPIPMLEHYRRAAWVKAPLDDEVNVSIRQGSDERASTGPDVLASRVAETLARLPAALAADREPDVVHIPWQGWSLTTDDFLTTRLMEIVVHSDDLAASVDLPTPEFSAGVARAVLGLLTGVAVERHGQVAVVRALSRPQRAPDHVSAF